MLKLGDAYEYTDVLVVMLAWRKALQTAAE